VKQPSSFINVDPGNHTRKPQMITQQKRTK
jgi:hypothetical protein